MRAARSSCGIPTRETADVADCADLHGHAQSVRVRTPQRDQITVIVIEEEEPLQLRACGHLGERPVRLGLLIRQKLHWHGRTVASVITCLTIFPPQREPRQVC
jgi:hypothetical protein